MKGIYGLFKKKNLSSYSMSSYSGMHLKLCSSNSPIPTTRQKP